MQATRSKRIRDGSHSVDKCVHLGYFLQRIALAVKYRAKTVSRSRHPFRVVGVMAGHEDELPSDKGQYAGSDARNAVNEQLRYVVIHSAPLSVVETLGAPKVRC